MLRINHLSLVQFRNYAAANFSFSKKVVGIAGPNGAGKTNLLDAVYYLCFTKSYFASGDAQLVMQGSSGFRVEGHFELPAGDQCAISAVLRETGKKELRCNNVLYQRMARHVGKLPAVMVAPDDVAIIIGGSEERRRVVDALICQLNPQYLLWLMEYNKLVQQRNSLLRQMAEQASGGLALLDVLDGQLVPRGNYVFAERQKFMALFLPSATAHYAAIAQTSEAIGIAYQSQLQQLDMATLLHQNRQKDLSAQRTTGGIHRDDLVLTLDSQPFKQYASQGQRKSMLFALKITEFEMLETQKGFAPILLLDDVFEKLDGNRMQSLLHEVCIEKNGQVLITDTHADRLTTQLAAIGADYELLNCGLP